MRIAELILLITLFSFSSICQEIKLVEKTFTNSKQISEKFYVLKSDGQTKHGAYEAYFIVTDNYHEDVKKGKGTSDYFIKVKGNYSNGKRTGVWVEYSSPQKIKAEGKYENDMKAGIWSTYKGSVTEKYDYDNDRELQPIIEMNFVRYPPKAREDGVQGTVMMQFELLSDCSVSNVAIIQSVRKDCDESAIQAVTKYYQLMKEHIGQCSVGKDTMGINFVLDE